MIRGFYSAASSLVAGLFRQELISHNLANIDVAGYKETGTTLGEFDHIFLQRYSSAQSGGNLTDVGGTSLGVITGGAITNYTAGALKQTDQPFDMALAGDGFFAVQTPDGERYTRDGRFTRDANNHLVTVDGNLLLGSNNQPITVPQGVTTGIASDGKVTVDNQAAGQIKLVTFANLKTDILRDGPNTFSAVNPGTVATNASLKQGFLESSNVDPAKAMTQMMTVSRAYEAAQRLMQMQDEMLGKAVNEVGQV